jgi:FkbM family methyltransferase
MLFPVVIFAAASAQDGARVHSASDVFNLPGVTYSELDATGIKLLWGAWSPRTRPLPPPSVSQSRCVWTRPSFGGDMCLMDDDRISRHVRNKGYWIGCDHYVEMWHNQRTREDNSKGRLGGDKLDVVVEVGANIGACTLQLLLHTNATVLAFEPSPLNLFHLTESLHRTALGNPSIASRVTVFPIAVGDFNGSDRIFVAKGNAGNSVVHETVRDHSRQDMSLSYPIEVRKLDSVLSAHAFSRSSSISIIKVDVQGFECRALSGMASIAQAGAISTMSIEIANGWLSAQGCSAKDALKQMRSLGFQLDPRWDTVPYCVRTYFGCDVTAKWERVSRAHCIWKRGDGDHPEAVAVCS